MNIADAWKQFSILMTGAFGILALLKDYKDKTTGHTTVWGRVALIGIVISTMCGFAAEVIDDSKKAATAATAAARDTQTREDINRSLSLIAEPKIQLKFRIDCSTQRFFDICKELDKRQENSISWSPVLKKFFPQSSPTLALDLRVTVTKSEKGLEKVDLLMATEEDPTNETLFTRMGDGGYLIREKARLEIQQNSGAILGTSQLEGTLLRIFYPEPVSKPETILIVNKNGDRAGCPEGSIVDHDSMIASAAICVLRTGVESHFD